MAGIFGNGVSQIGSPQPSYPTPQSMPQMPNYGPQQTSGMIPVYSVQSRENAESYPVPANSTALFMNYSGRKFWIKTEHSNGLSYDMEEMIFFTPSELQQYTQQLQSQTQTPPQNNIEYVSKSEFEELKKQFEEFIK